MKIRLIIVLGSLFAEAAFAQAADMPGPIQPIPSNPPPAEVNHPSDGDNSTLAGRGGSHAAATNKTYNATIGSSIGSPIYHPIGSMIGPK